MTSLTPEEYTTLSEDDRVMLDAALQAIPSERNAEFTAFMLSIRAIIKHDTAGIRNAVSGSFELLDRADDATRDMMEAAREMRAATEHLASTVAGAIAQIATLAADVHSLTEANEAEHQEIWTAIDIVQEAHWTTRVVGAALFALVIVVLVVIAREVFR